jgi:glucans biosynthesis protein
MQGYRFGYTLYWSGENDQRLSANKVLSTLIGVDPRDAQNRQFAIDFGGPKLSALPANAPPQAISSCSDNAEIVENQVFHNPFNNTWRVMLKLKPKPDNKNTVDLRCTLKKGDEVLSETWTYLWSPP